MRLILDTINLIIKWNLLHTIIDIITPAAPINALISAARNEAPCDNLPKVSKDQKKGYSNTNQ